jgi:hypothetical protein
VELTGAGTPDEYFRAGAFIAWAVFNKCQISPRLSLSFYRTIIGNSLVFKDLEIVDPSLFKSLTWILKTGRDLQLFFTDQAGVELVLGGKDKKVNLQNKEEYVQLYTNRRLKRDDPSLKSMANGFHFVIPQFALSLFDEKEMDDLISGKPFIDINELQRRTSYGENCNARVRNLFWEYMGTLDQPALSNLWRFVSGSSIMPHTRYFNPKTLGNEERQFTIQTRPLNETKGVIDLPRSHACSWVLIIPEYPSIKVMSERFDVAINWSIGFEDSCD